MVMDRLPGSCGSSYVAIQACSRITHTAKPQDSAAIGLRRCDLQHETSGRGAGYVAPTVGGRVVAPDDLRKGYRSSRGMYARGRVLLWGKFCILRIPRWYRYSGYGNSGTCYGGLLDPYWERWGWQTPVDRA